MSLCPLHWGGLNWTEHSGCGLTKAGAGSPPLGWLAALLLMQPRIYLVFFPTGALLVRVQLDVHQDALALLHRAAFHLGGPQLTQLLEVLLPTCRVLYLPLLNFMRSLSDHFSSLLKSSWMAAWSSDVSAISYSFVSWGNLLRICSGPLSRWLMKMLNRIRPSTDHWSTPPVTGHQLDVFCVGDHHHLSLLIQIVFSLIIQPAHRHLLSEDLMEAVSKALLMSSRQYLLHSPCQSQQSFHHRSLTNWSGTPQDGQVW